MSEMEDMTPESQFSEKQQKLYESMSEISEELWFAGWLTGNEFYVWDMIWDMMHKEPIPNADFDLFVIEKLDECRQLSQELNGWIAWPEDYEEPVFMTMKTWLKLKEKHESSTI